MYNISQAFTYMHVISVMDNIQMWVFLACVCVCACVSVCVCVQYGDGERALWSGCRSLPLIPTSPDRAAAVCVCDVCVCHPAYQPVWGPAGYVKDTNSSNI